MYSMHCPACIRNGLPTRGEQVLGGGERTGVRAVRPPPTAGSDPGKTTAKGRSCYTERITHHRNGLEPRLGWRGSEAGAMGERRNEKTPGGQGSGASSGQINQHFPMPFAYNRLTRDHFRSRNRLYVLDGLLENDTILWPGDLVSRIGSPLWRWAGPCDCPACDSRSDV
jgi:hypothetical protein